MLDFISVSIFLTIFEAQNKNTMRRITIFAMLAALFLCNACDDTVSKQFKAMEEEISSVENQINTIDDCDELQMMNFAILGLRSDMDNYHQDSEMTDTEIGQLDDMIDKLEAAWNGKWASLNCEEGISNDVLDTSGEEVGDFE